jgi:hypothetical protein
VDSNDHDDRDYDEDNNGCYDNEYNDEGNDNDNDTLLNDGDDDNASSEGQGGRRRPPSTRGRDDDDALLNYGDDDNLDLFRRGNLSSEGPAAECPPAGLMGQTLIFAQLARESVHGRGRRRRRLGQKYRQVPRHDVLGGLKRRLLAGTPV